MHQHIWQTISQKVMKITYFLGLQNGNVHFPNLLLI